MADPAGEPGAGAHTGSIERHPSALGMFSDAVVLTGPGRMIHVAGHVAVGDNGRLVVGGIVPETRQVLANIQRTLARADAALADVTRMQVFLVSLDDYAGFAEVRNELLREIRPASTAVQVAGLLLGASIEIEVTAFVRSRFGSASAADTDAPDR